MIFTEEEKRALEDKMVAFRRERHKYPENGWTEFFATSAVMTWDRQGCQAFVEANGVASDDLRSVGDAVFSAIERRRKADQPMIGF